MKNIKLYTFYLRSLIGLMAILIVIVFNSCSGCSQSGLNNSKRNKNSTVAHGDVGSRHGKTILKMEKSNGVYLIPIEVNGVSMSFIFDTGAGLISISATEAAFLYKQGKLKDEDFIGKANFVDANGDISEGTIIILKTIKIGDRVISDIQASVVHNLVAPLLLGQSALEKFGKVSIDYSKNEITFE